MWGMWYEREILVPLMTHPERTELRFDAVAHHAHIWLDGVLVGEHSGGFLPFVLDLSKRIVPGKKHRMIVKVNNVLSWQTLPPGEIRIPEDTGNYPPGYRWQKTQFDFFNYAGIRRPVRLVFTPRYRIECIQVETGFEGNSGWIDYVIETFVSDSDRISLVLFDDQGGEVASGIGLTGRLEVTNPY